MQAQESYGRVDFSSESTPTNTFNSAGTSFDPKSNLRRRRNDTNSGPASTKATKKDTAKNRKNFSKNKQHFLHNAKMGILVTLPMISIGTTVLFGLIPSITSRTTVFILLVGSLSNYCFDLFNNRDGVFLSIWITFVLVSISLIADFVFVRENVDIFGSYNNSDTHENDGMLYHTIRMLRLGLLVMHISCLSIWETLQLSSLFLETDLHFISLLEELLFAITPLTFSSFMTYFSWLLITWAPHDYIFFDFLWIPHLFSIFLSFSIWLVGNLPRSFHELNKDIDEYTKEHKSNPSNIDTALKRSSAILHVCLILIIPPVTHLLSMKHRLIGVIPSKHHLYDFFLTLTIPILLLTTLKHKSITIPHIIRKHTPTSPQNKAQRYKDLYDASIFQSFTVLHNFLTTKLAAMSVFVTCFIIHDRNILDICSSSSFYFHGSAYPSYITTIFLLGGYTCIYLYYYFQKGVIDFFGEYTQEFLDLVLLLGVACFHFALALPMDTAPVMMLSAVSFISFVSTRQIIYILIPIVTAGIQLHYKVMIRLTFVQAFLSSGISLFSFTMLAIVAMLLLILVVGIVYRDPNDTFSSIQIDMTGIILSIYSALLSFFESTLMSENPEQSAPSLQPFPVYPPYMPPITSTILFLISLNLSQTKAISKSSFLIISCISVGKILPVSAINSDINIFVHIILTSAILFTILAPYIFLQPLQRSSTNSDKAAKELQNHLFIYSFAILPIAICVSHRTIISPVLHFVSKHIYNNDLQRISIYSNIGLLLSIWGFCTMSLASFVLPSGGADSIKKSGVIMFFIGILSSLIWKENTKSFPSFKLEQESISHVYMKSRWGIVVSALAFLLVLTGPLQFIDKKPTFISTSKSELPSLARVMIFSVIFGCGIAWFIALEIMEGSHVVSAILTTVSCMVIAFLGTILTVLAYYLDLRNIRELFKLTQLTVLVFLMFFGVSSASILVGNSHLFGLGGCISGYFTVCALFSLSLSVALKARHINEKNATTRDLGNKSCFISYTICNLLLYGQFGVMKSGHLDGMVIFDTPSLVGTVFVSFMLLLLENKHPINRKLRASKMQHIALREQLYESLSKAKKFALPVASVSLIFFLATLYTIFIRGCISEMGVLRNDGIAIQTNHEDVFQFVYGSSNRVTFLPGEDVASMAKKKFLHTKSVTMAAKLAGSGFCTSEKIFGPLFHFFGTIAVLPSLYNLLIYLFFDTKLPFVQVVAMLPFNLLPLFVCTGIPFLRANALLSLIGGIYQVSRNRKEYWSNRMKI